jgi:hypothetical protein
VRRRITDAFARLGARTPVPGAYGRHDAPTRQDPVVREDEAARQAGAATQAGVAGQASVAGQAGADRTAGPDGGLVPFGNETVLPGGQETNPAGSQDKTNRNRALVAGAGVLAVAAIAGVLVAPKVFGPADPGCTVYSGAALTAYNKTIGDLNAKRSQAVLTKDMSTTITGLNSAIAQAQSAPVTSALNGLLIELKTVRSGIEAGSVPASTVSALNAASTVADNAC